MHAVHVLVVLHCSACVSMAVRIQVLLYRYAEEFRPIMNNCPCYSCLNHTKAYIHHLLDTKELLAHTLLMKYVNYIILSYGWYML